VGVVIRTTRNEDSETLINNRQNGRRRGRGGTQVRGPGSGPDRGNRIDNRARGNAAQLHEKYRNLARDAQTQGDRVMTEYYLQFADHYFRVLNESRARFDEQNQHQQRRPRFESDDFEDGGDDAEGGDDASEMEHHQPHHHQQQRAEQPRRDEREPRRNDRDMRRRERGPIVAEGEAEAPREAREHREAPARESYAEEEAGEARRGRRGRRPRDIEGEANGEAAPQRIEIDRLPPAFGITETETAAAAPSAPEPDAEAAEPAPRRRRTRRAASSTEDTIVAA